MSSTAWRAAETLLELRSVLPAITKWSAKRLGKSQPPTRKVLRRTCKPRLKFGAEATHLSPCATATTVRSQPQPQPQPLNQLRSSRRRRAKILHTPVRPSTTLLSKTLFPVYHSPEARVKSRQPSLNL